MKMGIERVLRENFRDMGEVSSCIIDGPEDLRVFRFASVLLECHVFATRPSHMQRVGADVLTC